MPVNPCCASQTTQQPDVTHIHQGNPRQRAYTPYLASIQITVGQQNEHTVCINYAKVLHSCMQRLDWWLFHGQLLHLCHLLAFVGLSPQYQVIVKDVASNLCKKCGYLWRFPPKVSVPVETGNLSAEQGHMEASLAPPPSSPTKMCTASWTLITACICIMSYKSQLCWQLA